MKNCNIRFERDPSLDRIEVIIRAPERDETVAELMEKLADKPPDKLMVFNASGIKQAITTREIIFASADGKLVNLVTKDGRWYTRQTLQSLEETMDKRRFVRISRFEIVNLDHVVRYDFTIAGTLRIELSGGMETWASRRCIPAIRRKLMGKE